MNNHVSRAEGYLHAIELFPPFIVERIGLIPCQKGEACADSYCDGWWLAGNPEDILAPKDWEAWKQFVKVGW